MDTKELQAIKNRFGIIGLDPKLNRAIEVALQVSVTDLSVLVMGESGVGKESFPRIIHAFSRRKSQKYLSINCGAIPEGTIDSELFGHEKGSFTGAISDRKGYMEEADGGTIFLDEVGELPMATQARLLRVLETGEFLRVGSSEVRHTNVRVVAATNVNIREAIARGRFREDLYYRLAAVSIFVPPLRERDKRDIGLLFRTFSAQIASDNHFPKIELDEEAERKLASCYWRGNIRQLKNVVNQISVLEQGRKITVDILNKYLAEGEMNTQLVLASEVNSSRPEARPDANTGLIMAWMQRLQGDLDRMNSRISDIAGHTIPAQMVVEETPTIRAQVVEHDDPSAQQPTEVAQAYPQPAQPVYPAQPTQYPQQAGQYPPQAGAYPAVAPAGPAYGAAAGALNTTPMTPMDELTTVTLPEMETRMIKQTLIRCRGNRTKAARILGISSRTLFRRIKDLDIHV